MNETTPQEPLRRVDLPFVHDRDGAWRMLIGQGRSVEVDGTRLITCPADVGTGLRSPHLYSSKKAFDSLGSPIPLVPIAFDPPDHTRYRRILQPFFSPKTIRPMEQAMREQARALIEPVAARGHCEFLEEVAVPFPTAVFLTLFGLPLGMRARFIEWKEAILGLSDISTEEVSEEAMLVAAEMYTYLAETVAERRAAPGEDVLSQVLRDAEDGGLTDAEAIGLAFLFLLAGLDTVTDALGFAFQRLAGAPERRREIVENPGLIPAAVEELLRLDPPAPFLPRVTTEPVEVAGASVPADERVIFVLGALNHDPAEHTDPGSIDFHRADGHHVSFGIGAHRCLGSHLARLEMKIIFEEWHRLVPEYSVAPDGDPKVKWPRGTVGLDRLPLVLAPAQAR